MMNENDNTDSDDSINLKLTTLTSGKKLKKVC